MENDITDNRDVVVVILKSTKYIPTCGSILNRVKKLFLNRCNDTLLFEELWYHIINDTGYSFDDNISMMLSIISYIKPPGYHDFSEMGTRLLEGYQTPRQLIYMIRDNITIDAFKAMRDQSVALLDHIDILEAVKVNTNEEWIDTQNLWLSTSPQMLPTEWWREYGLSIRPYKSHLLITTHLSRSGGDNNDDNYKLINIRRILSSSSSRSKATRGDVVDRNTRRLLRTHYKIPSSSSSNSGFEKYKEDPLVEAISNYA
ncbi:hypothetical protein [Trichoplusia ni ascovirus 2c]|uniref:hypothetical protein n=1 Tax=Trichoplusia ni ascovirus 2c TaxID=328615 RepID=UPI0000E441EA|nr:hypothetical protein TNAV2c_gp018 [Trichoplusia ni ascovirus 2c]ABF70535.1 hypothetical protein [Trichoplusia ni ascovirus 2c]